VPLKLELLLASAALPFIFPAVKVHREYFGDGSMRQIAPVSPALHLGADRVLIVGTGRQTQESARARSNVYPSLAQIAGHALNSIFLDSLMVDIERLERINRTVTLVPQAKLAEAGVQLRPVKVHREYFGDGSMRQIAPVSPALHLGADRVLIVGTGRQTQDQARARSSVYPSFAQIAGHALNSIFLDSLAVDIERLERINRTVRLIPPERLADSSTQLRPVKVLFISPSQPIERIAARFLHELPPTVRFILKPTGALNRSGSNLASYLLFEQSFCRALIDLGYQDTISREAEIQEFFAPAEEAAHG
jgi:predicted acylesterase/phospholipase RssA